VRPPAVTRAWTDANGNYVPDCDLLDPNANDRRPSGGDLCGQLSNLNFGKPVFSGSFDPALLEGSGVRPSDWQIGVSIQQQVMTGVAVEVGYFRRWLQHFTVIDNLAVAAADFDRFSIVAPADPRLPNGGGYTISGLYNVSPTKSGQTNSYTTLADSYGSQTSMYNGILMNVSARGRNGLSVQGGINVGKTVTDNCEVQAVLPEIAPLDPFCHNDPGFITRVSGLAAYTLPKLDMLVSGTFRSDQGAPLQAQYVVTSASRTADAWPSAVRERAERHREPARARRSVWRSRQRVRPARRQDPARRTNTHQRWRGHLQHVQRERGADLQPGIQPRWTLARADDGDGGALREAERLHRFLVGACRDNGADGGNASTRSSGGKRSSLGFHSISSWLRGDWLPPGRSPRRSFSSKRLTPSIRRGTLKLMTSPAGQFVGLIYVKACASCTGTVAAIQWDKHESFCSVTSVSPLLRVAPVPSVRSVIDRALVEVLRQVRMY
jgi:hypothetical protein